MTPAAAAATGMAVLASHHPTGVTESRDGVALAAAGVSGRPFNTGWVTAAPIDAETTAEWAHERLAGTGRPFAIYVPAPLRESVAAPFARLGLPLGDTLPGMARAATEDVPPPPDGLTIRRAHDADSMAEHATAMARGFGAPDPSGAVAVLVPGLASDGRAAMVTGYAGGEAVASAFCLLGGGVGNLFGIAVREEVRGRGYGTAVTWAAVAAAARMGAATVALQATPMGEPVYLRMGFETEVVYDRYDG